MHAHPVLCVLLLFFHMKRNSPASCSHLSIQEPVPGHCSTCHGRVMPPFLQHHIHLQFLLFSLQDAYISVTVLERDILGSDILKSLQGFPTMVPCRHFLAYMFEVTPLTPCFHYVFPVSCTILGSVLVNSVHHCLPGLLVVPSLSFLVLSAHCLCKTNVLIIYKGIYLCHFKF